MRIDVEGNVVKPSPLQPAKQKKKKKVAPPTLQRDPLSGVPVLRPQVPVETRVRNIMTGYWEATGHFPHPKKVTDALSISTGSEDVGFWKNHYNLLSDPRLPKAVRAEAMRGDSMYEGDPRVELPTIDKVVLTVFKPFYALPAFKEMSKKDIDENHTVWSPLKSIPELMDVSDGVRKGRMETMAAQGFRPRTSGPDATLNRSASAEAKYEDAVKQMVFANRAPAAVWLGDKDASEAVWASGMLPIGGNITVRDAFYSIKNANDDAIKAMIYYNALKAKDPRQTTQQFIREYVNLYRADRLPSQVYKEQKASGAVNLMLYTVKAGGDMFGYTMTQKAIRGYDAAAKGYELKEMGAGGARFTAAQKQAADAVASLSSVVEGAFQGLNKTGPQGALSLLGITPPTNTQLAGEAIKLPFRAAAMITYLGEDMYRDPAAWKNYVLTTENLANRWRESADAMPAYEWLRLVGLDPVEHQELAFLAEMGVEGAIGYGADAAAGKIARTVLGTATAKTIMTRGGVLNYRDLMAAAQGNKGAAMIRDLLPWVGPEDAIHIADNLHDAGAVDLFWNDKLKFKAIYPDKDLSAPSLTATIKHKFVTNEQFHPRLRSLFITVDDSPWNLRSLGDADRRVYNFMLHGGMSAEDALEEAGRMTRALAHVGDDPLGVHAATDLAEGAKAAVKGRLENQPASRAFREAHGQTFQDVELVGGIKGEKTIGESSKLTAWDEFQQFQRELLGVGPGDEAPGRWYDPDPKTGEEMSFAVDRNAASRAEADVHTATHDIEENNRVMREISDRLKAHGRALKAQENSPEGWIAKRDELATQLQYEADKTKRNGLRRRIRVLDKKIEAANPRGATHEKIKRALTYRTQEIDRVDPSGKVVHKTVVHQPDPEVVRGMEEAMAGEPAGQLDEMLKGLVGVPKDPKHPYIMGEVINAETGGVGAGSTKGIVELKAALEHTGPYGDRTASRRITQADGRIVKGKVDYTRVVVTHEVGHVHLNGMPAPMQKRVHKIFVEALDNYAARNNTPRGHIFMEPETFGEDFVTHYAATNYHEFWAENYAAWRTGTYAEHVNPELRKIFEENFTARPAGAAEVLPERPGLMAAERVEPEKFAGFRDRSKNPMMLDPEEEVLGPQGPDYLPPEKRTQKLAYYKDAENDAGYALKPTAEGGLDLIALHNNGSVKGAGRVVLAEAVSRGASHLYCFDVGFLRKLYQEAGFEIVPGERIAFAEKYAPEGWDYATMGRPDVIRMEWRGGSRELDDVREGLGLDRLDRGTVGQPAGGEVNPRMGQRPGEPAYRGVPAAERPALAGRGQAPAGLLGDEELRGLQSELASREVEKTKLTNERQKKYHIWAATRSEVRGQPLTEAQLAGDWHLGDISETALAIFNAGPRMRGWVLGNRRFKLDWINQQYRKLILFRLATMVNIVTTDEMLRSVISGVNPFTSKHISDDLRDLIASNSMMREKVSGMMRELKRTSYHLVQPGERGYARGLKLYVGTFNAGPRGQKVVRDWWELFEEELDTMGAKSPESASQAMREAAAEKASRRFAEKVHTDPFYQGVDGKPGFLEGTGRKQSAYAEAALPGEGLDTTADFIAAVNARASRAVARRASMRHLRYGAQAITDADLKNTKLLSDIYGHVQVEDSANVRHMADKLGIKGPRASQAAYYSIHPDEIMWGALDKMSTALKERTFAGLYDKKLTYLRKHLAGKMTEEEMKLTASRTALAQTETLSYSGTKTLFESQVRNLVMFLPAYRQSMQYWLPKVAKNPWKSYAVLNSLQSAPDINVPEGVPVIGGEAAWSLPHFASLFGVDITNPLRSVLPPLAPTITLPLDFGNTISGSPELAAWYKTLTGFDPGFPLTSVRWFEAMTYGVTGLIGPTWQDTFENIGSHFGAERMLLQGRHNAAIANLVLQAIQSDGKSIDPRKAEQHVDAIEAIRGGFNFAVPGNMRRVLPTIDVVDPALGEGVQKVDLAALYQSQADYLGAARPEDQQTVLRNNPAYKVVSRAFELTGDAQFKYLSQHRWIIPLVVRKRDQKAGIDPDSQEAEVASAPLTGTESTTTRDPMSVADYAAGLRDKYQQVDRYVLGVAYGKMVYVTGVGDVPKAVNDAAKAEYAADKQRGAGKVTWYDWYQKRYFPKAVAAYNAKFAADHKAELLAAVKAHPDDPDSSVLGAKPGETEPVWVGAIQLSNSSVNDGDFALFQKLEQSGAPYAKTLLEQHPMYGEYLKQKQQKEVDRRGDIIYAATKQYKSGLSNDQLALLGLKWSDKDLSKLKDYLIVVDQQQKLKSNLTFGTTEYWAQYNKSKAILTGAKRRLGLASKDLSVIDSHAAELIIKSGITQMHQVVPLGDTRHHRLVDNQKLWTDLRKAWYDPKAKLSDILALREKAPPRVRAQFDEANRAWQWQRVLGMAVYLREMLSLGYNKYTHQQGFSIGSKTMGQPVVNVGVWLIKDASEASEEFAVEWKRYNERAGNNLIKDILDPAK